MQISTPIMATFIKHDHNPAKRHAPSDLLDGCYLEGEPAGDKDLWAGSIVFKLSLCD